MDQRGGGDQGVAVGEVEAGALAGHVEVDRQGPLAEPRQDRVLQPAPQQGALGGVAALEPQDAQLQLEQPDRGEPEQGGRGAVRPGADRAAQLGHDVGVEEIHSIEVRGAGEGAGQVLWLEVDVVAARHDERLGEARPPAQQLLVVGVAQQHMRRPAAVGDDHGPALGGLLGAAGVLVELAAGDGGNAHAADDRMAAPGARALVAMLLQKTVPRSAAAA